ncbi:polyhydroxyalkanoate granule-associated phasin [Vandammella animalimorsus]|uniref:Uncharacterized protein n=1 Tax=Vandammella animalimorsus TaxID=2029117 RepID=A0A2A2B0Y7_9BURK|nr:polyhydroxyalkanoate granule-associated phasin [Vandammella animalimorsus]PAT43718.1 hypothetical protein CK621_02380 [Vandammella animalimorsus]
MTAGKCAKLARKSGELMQAAPQVVAVRVGRMLTAGPQPSARDRREFQRMGAEKVEAFAQSWQAMAVQALAAQQQWALWCTQAWWQMALGGWMQPGAWEQLARGAQQRLREAGLDTALSGIQPVHRRATANARRLTGPRRSRR